jgi:hypothetical protein
MKETFAATAGATVLATANAINEATPVSVGLAGAALVTICGFAYWLGRKIEQNTQETRAVNQRLRAGDKRFDKNEKDVRELGERVSRMEKHCLVVHGLNARKTQKIEVED